MVEMVTPEMQEELLEVAKLVVSAAAKREPCRECDGKGWLAVRYYAPSSATLQSTVRVCDCMKGEGR